jgi:hypothetical protein
LDEEVGASELVNPVTSQLKPDPPGRANSLAKMYVKESVEPPTNWVLPSLTLGIGSPQPSAVEKSEMSCALAETAKVTLRRVVASLFMGKVCKN